MSREVVRSVLVFLSGYKLKSLSEDDIEYYFETYLRKHPEHDGGLMKAERAEIFSKLVMAEEGFPEDVKKEFYDYWTESRPADKKMRWEKEKSWDLRKRMYRFWRNKVTCFDKYPERWGLDGPVDVKKEIAENVITTNAGRSWNKG